jgi:glycopeptide antibiotics resistance protein
MGAVTSNRRHLLFLLLAYLAFVVYGSLVPFRFRPHSLEEAWRLFQAIPYLDLGVGSRADWVANLVLYVPLSFLACVWIEGLRPVTARVRWAASLLVLLFCLALALGIEFTQLFFAPRTVSLNDLLAETLGTLVGIGLWYLGRDTLWRMWQWFLSGGRNALVAAAVGYAALYLVLALFPYDFLISLRELEWKLASGHNGWLVAPACGGVLHCAARLVAEALALIPLGVLLGLLDPRRRPWRLFVAGSVLGLVLELVQLLLASGTSQGLSVLMRGTGLVAGGLVARGFGTLGAVGLAGILRRLLPFALIPYLLLVMALNGWLTGNWLAPEVVAGRLAEVRLIPFYYHYFSSEPAALASLLANAGMYAPVGLALWARGTNRRGRGLKQSGLIAALLSLLMELGKLGLSGRHADLTNPLIAALGAVFAFALADWLGRAVEGVVSAAVPSGDIQRPRSALAAPVSRPVAGKGDRSSVMGSERSVRRGGLSAMVLAGGAISVGLYGLLSYPVGRVWLALGLAAYGVSLWLRPSRWLFVVPALLPVLDFSPYTGRLLLDELDLLVLVTLVVGYWRIFPRAPAPWPNRLVPLAVGLLGLTWCVATLIGSASAPSTSSHSPLEAWMVGKGLLWALLLLPLLRRVRRGGEAAARTRLVHGSAVGLALVGLSVLWQRHLFVGLTDFDNVFRVTGTFSSMHTGGAYIEAFIAFAFPAQLVWVLTRRNRGALALGLALVAVSSYAMAVTFSRGGYAGLAVGLVVVTLGTLRGRSRLGQQRPLLLGGLATVVLAAALPVLSGGFAQQRLALAAQDLSIRLAHWGRALDLMEGGALTTTLGMGFGQYPSQYLWRADVAQRPATFSVLEEGGNRFLRLGAGEAAYLDQVVPVEPGASYRLSLRLRQPAGAASLKVPICEKALLYSFQCVWPELAVVPGASGWTELNTSFRSGELGGGGNWPHRPVKLSLFNPGPVTAVDVDDLSLRSQDGRELLANGDFSAGVARWLFVTDRDLAWHIHQQEVELFFSQGALGLLAMLLVLAAAARALGPALRSGDPAATALAGGLAAFLAVGLLGSTLDTARLSMLFYLGCLGAAVLFGSRRPGGRAPTEATVRGRGQR